MFGDWAAERYEKRPARHPRTDLLTMLQCAYLPYLTYTLRQACDFCCQKKIRCNAERPKCSACSTHNVACLWTPGLHSKKTSSSPLHDEFVWSRSDPSLSLTPADETKNPRSNSRRFADIESRLSAIESRIHQDDGNQTITARREDEGALGTVASFTSSMESILTPSSTYTPNADKSIGVGDVSADDRFPLPPRDYIQRLAADYFADFNQAMPLSHHRSFLDMLQNWYLSPPGDRDDATWAAINVVLAIALRHTTSASSDSNDSSDTLASTCIQNAQAVLDRLVYRDQDLKGLQVLLGLAILFLATPHPQPACVLIATAVKLVHRLKLHVGSVDDSDPEVSDSHHRRCLFWITYIIDRDISVHTSEPYLLQDNDIGVAPFELGPLDGNDDDGSPSTHMFGYRTRLAHIQGKVYDLVYSVRASHFSANQKQAATERLYRSLREWRDSLPKALEINACPENQLRQCVSLHAAYYQTLFMAHRTHALEEPWTKTLTNYSDSTGYGSGFRLSNPEPGPNLLPPNWTGLVNASRLCLELLNSAERHDKALQ